MESGRIKSDPFMLGFMSRLWRLVANKQRQKGRQSSTHKMRLMFGESTHIVLLFFAVASTRRNRRLMLA